MSRLNAKWNDFTLRGKAWDSWWQDGPNSSVDARSGGGVLAASASLAGTGRKANAGGATFAAQATLLGNGGRAAAGGGTVSEAVAFVGTGRKAALGAGSLAVSAALVGDGIKRESNGGSITAVATGQGAGEKAATGGGTLQVVAKWKGSGTSNQHVIAPRAGRFYPVVVPIRRHGGEQLHLRVAFTGSGIALQAMDEDEWLIDDALLDAA